MFNQKGNIVVILAIILIVLSLGAIGTTFILNQKNNYQNAQADKEPVTSISDKTISSVGSNQEGVPVAEKKDTTYTEHVSSTQIDNTGPIKTKISMSADVTSTVDCGDQGCFDEKFKVCEKAKLLVSATKTIEFYSEIIGPEGGKCKVLTKYPKNPNPAWVNKTMTCLYDNSKDWQTAMINRMQEITDAMNDGAVYTGSCQGDLLKLIQNS